MAKVKQYKIYPMEQIVSKAKKTKTPYCLIRLTETRKDMIADINDFTVNQLSEDANLFGYYIGYDLGKKNKTGCCAIIFLNKDDYSLGVITHEAVHVSIGLMAAFNFDVKDFRGDEYKAVPPESPEEFMALSVETIVCSVAKKLGVNV